VAEERRQEVTGPCACDQGSQGRGTPPHLGMRAAVAGVLPLLRLQLACVRMSSHW
jgi:hypothetical protein